MVSFFLQSATFFFSPFMMSNMNSMTDHFCLILRKSSPGGGMRKVEEAGEGGGGGGERTRVGALDANGVHEGEELGLDLEDLVVGLTVADVNGTCEEGVDEK